MEKVTTNEIHTLIEAFKADNRTRTLTVGICRVIVTKKASSGKVCIMIRGENDHLLSTYEIDEYSLEKLTEEVNSTIEQEYDEL